MIRPIFSVVIAALLMTGAVFGQPVSDVGADTTQPAPRKVSALAVSLSETAVQKIQTQSQTVTRQQAIDAALAHAGLTEAEVKGLEAEYDAEAVGSHWDVDFRSGDWEYDYEVDAKTGAVTKHEKEYDPVKRATEPAATEPKATEPAATEPKATEPKPTEAPAAEKVTRQQAIDAALAHAGLTEAEVKGLEAEYDAEAVGSHWDVDFRSGDWEYDYEVDAKTGAVTKHEKEYDPVKRATEPKATEPVATEPKATEPAATEPKATEPAATEPKATEPAATEPKATEPKPTEAPAAEKVTRQQAIDAALAHAGLTEAEVKGLEAEYDFDDGAATWEVEFRSGRYEYSYELRASDGKILSWEKEYDD